MYYNTAELASDLKRTVASIRSRLAELDTYADLLAEVQPEDEYTAAMLAPGKVADMLGALGRTTASGTVNLLTTAATIAVAAEREKD